MEESLGDQSLDRRHFIVVVAGLTIWPRAARAQYPIVGVVSSRSLADSAISVAAFRRGLADSGYVDGENLEIIFRWAEGHYDRLPALAADLARRQVAVILATGGNPLVDRWM
jgi:putative tryptophan/tyrosine transport system substrate-binding protein